ncbi:MAG: hypothetical protein ACM3WU_01790 [Bacillota bacterium]
MTVIAEYNFSKARSNLTELIDGVQQLAPAVIRPRKKTEDASVVLSRAFLKMILQEAETSRVQPRVLSEADGSVTVILEPLDIAVNSGSREAAIQEAVNEAVEYAREYLDPSNVAFYLRSPNRRPHLSTVLRIAICDSTPEILEVLNLA